MRALLFDVFGTVVDWRGTVIREGEALAMRRGWPVDRVDWAAFADRWRKEGYTAALARITRGEEPWARVDDLHRRMLDTLLHEHGIRDLDEPAVAQLNRVWHRLTPWPDALAGLERLQRRYTVAPLSNGDFALLTNMAKHAALPWDCILSAELFGAYKQRPEVYLGAVQLLGIAPAEALMVAAHPSDLDAARAAGLRTAYVPRPLEFGAPTTEPQGVTSPLPSRFDVIADDFLALAAALGC
ncbi:MAG: Haloacid dehalogenase, type II [uncultured Chloroflexi bacterium]|uniref:Haloacid dehalogenase, type II n=1 Tax=uncultured Chloroflexota bacterium TaxID=166587 RepID=A0A6J4IHG0_9CHLR|nr:MAG: Haloacid dehalogenase, type II [uncultured Chloroflexota bacterium]